MSKTSVAPPRACTLPREVHALMTIEGDANVVAGKLRALALVVDLIDDDDSGSVLELVKEALDTQAAKVEEISTCAVQARRTPKAVA